MDNSEYAEKMNSMRNELARTKTPVNRRRVVRRGILGAASGPNRNHFDFTPYEGQLVRVNRDKVYLVKNGQGTYVSSLPLPDGRGWESVREVNDVSQMSKKEKRQVNSKFKPSIFASKKVKQAWEEEHANDKTAKVLETIRKVGIGVGAGLVAAPLAVAAAPVVAGGVKKVVSSIGGGKGVTNPAIVTTSTNIPANSNSLIDKITGIASNVSPGVKNAVIKQGQEILTDKLGDLTRSPEMLPKTKALVDAERYVDAGGGEQPQALQSSISMFSSTAVMMTVGAIVLLIVFSKINNN